MSSIVLLGLVLVLFVLVLTALVALGLSVYRRLTRRPVHANREWRLVRLTRAAGVVAGVLSAVAVLQTGSYGVGAMLAPAVFGLCVLLATALGETVVRPRRPEGARSASLSPRRISDYRPRFTTALVATMLVVSAATMLLTTLTASHDESTGGYRQVSCSAAEYASSRGPYPGSYYTVPLALVLLVVVLVAGVAARQVVQRPRGMAETDLDDDALRRRSLDVIVSATGLAVGAPLVGVALLAGGGLLGLTGGQQSCAAGWMAPVGIALLVTAVLAIGASMICAGRLLLGVASVPDPGRAGHRIPASR